MLLVVSMGQLGTMMQANPSAVHACLEILGSFWAHKYIFFFRLIHQVELPLSNSKAYAPSTQIYFTLKFAGIIFVTEKLFGPTETILFPIDYDCYTLNQIKLNDDIVNS